MSNEKESLNKEEIKKPLKKGVDINYEIEEWEDEILNLCVKILRGIYGYGSENPSPLHKKA